MSDRKIRIEHVAKSEADKCSSLRVLLWGTMRHAYQCGFASGASWSDANPEKADRDWRDVRIRQLEDAIRDVDLALRVPAAEYVPAIGDAFKIIDAAQRCAE